MEVNNIVTARPFQGRRSGSRDKHTFATDINVGRKIRPEALVPANLHIQLTESGH